MKEEEKNLLFVVLSALLPHRVKCKINNRKEPLTLIGIGVIGPDVPISLMDSRGKKLHVDITEVRPFLRSMSEMTPEEWNEYEATLKESSVGKRVDFLNSHYLDDRGLISMDLAKEAPKNMYNLKQDMLSIVEDVLCTNEVKDLLQKKYNLTINQVADWLEECIGKKEEVQPYSSEIEFVDMGLPSGTLWADRAIGAKQPNDYGEYFRHDEIGEETLNEMPTFEEIRELIENCTWEEYNMNGTIGTLATSKNNGNTLFFPYSGLQNGFCPGYAGSIGYFWSASIYPNDISFAYYFYVLSGGAGSSYLDRYYAFPIRKIKRTV